MNNNRNQNRRRGRGNNRPQGGGQQLNRIDSRARGNAPQLLEKYRKLAQDSAMNGDRVQAEYFLQFADHYFRVIADTRRSQDEQRGRRDDRYGEGGEDRDDDNEFRDDGEIQGFDQPGSYRREEPREPREQREPRAARYERPEEPAPQAEPDEARADDSSAAEFEPAGGNPFVRGSRGLRPRRSVRDESPAEEAPLGLDPMTLPPAISEARDAVAADAVAEDAPAPRRRGRPRRTAEDDGNEPLEAVNS